MRKDELWESYMLLRYGDQWKERKLTASERGRMNKGLKELRDIGASPEALQQRYKLWMKRHSSECGAPSINALVSNWNSLEEIPIKSSKLSMHEEWKGT